MGLLPMIKWNYEFPVIAMDYLTKFITFGALKAFNETKIDLLFICTCDD
jgi:hypothetical protein